MCPRIAVCDTVRFYISKVEKSVSQNRKTECRTELILMVDRNRKRIPILGIQVRIAEILPQAAMDLVGAGLNARVHDRPGGVSELGTETARLHRELGQGVRRGANDIALTVEEVDKVGVIVHAVENEIVLLCSLPIRHKITAAAASGMAEWRRNSGSQLRDIDEVAPVQGRVVDRLGANYLLYGSVSGLQQRRGRSDCDRFRNDASLQHQVHAHTCLDVHANVALSHRTEAAGICRDAVVADFQRGYNVHAAAICLGPQIQTGIEIVDRDGRIRDHRTRGILDVARDGALVGLSETTPRQDHLHRRQNKHADNSRWRQLPPSCFQHFHLLSPPHHSSRSPVSFGVLEQSGRVWVEVDIVYVTGER